MGTHSLRGQRERKLRGSPAGAQHRCGPSFRAEAFRHRAMGPWHMGVTAEVRDGDTPALPAGSAVRPMPPLPWGTPPRHMARPQARGDLHAPEGREHETAAKSRAERVTAMALCSSRMLGTECHWQVLRRLGQTFLYTASPTLVPKSLPNYVPCPCLSLVFKHPGLLMCQINSGEQLEPLPLTEGKGRVFLLSPQQ